MVYYTQKELADWLKSKVSSPAGYRSVLLNSPERNRRDSTVIGRLFFFSYDAKGKDYLQVWDRYPLVFPIEKYPAGFLGLNLHYLNIDERRWLLETLSGYAQNKRMTATTRLRLSYSTLLQARSFNSLVRPCIKKYLFSHVRSKFIELEPDDWDKVLELPLEMFIRKS